MFLTAGEGNTPLPYPRIIPLGKALDEIMQLRRTGRSHYLLRVGIHGAIGYVIPYRSREQERMLLDYPHGPAQRFQRDVADIGAVN